MDVLTEAECNFFMNALKSERLETMFSFPLASGLRPKEYLALQSKDVDFNKQTATVCRAVIRLPKSKWYFSEPKTKSSRRTLPLPISLLAEIHQHRRKQKEERLTLGSAWQDFDLGFSVGSKNVFDAFKYHTGFKTSIKKRRTSHLFTICGTHTQLNC